MKLQLLEYLCCPDCEGDLVLTDGEYLRGEIENGRLICNSCSRQFPIIRYIPRFVPSENYASNFGFQWNQFRKTQLDSYSKVPISQKRFFDQTGLEPEWLSGKLVLDVGCGAGRFSEIALSHGALLLSLDYSSAVEACRDNLSHYDNLNLVQADIYHMPIKSEKFDLVYCFGVLQHTPDVEKAFKTLSIPVGPKGRLVVDVYPKIWQNYLWPKYWIRPISKRLPQKMLFQLVKAMVTCLLPVSLMVGKIPKAGPKLRYAIPVANYDGIFPLSKSQLREWAVLDTFDMLAPQYDFPQSEKILSSWFRQAGMKHVEIIRKGVLVGRGKR